jgi:hypothetical protein
VHHHVPRAPDVLCFGSLHVQHFSPLLGEESQLAAELDVVPIGSVAATSDSFLSQELLLDEPTSLLDRLELGDAGPGSDLGIADVEGEAVVAIAKGETVVDRVDRQRQRTPVIADRVEELGRYCLERDCLAISV